MTSEKRHFFKHFLNVLHETSTADVKLMHYEVFKISRRYLQRFWSYRENPGGCRFCPAPQRDAS